MNRAVQDRIYTLYMTVYLVISLPKMRFTHRIYVVLANPRYEPFCGKRVRPKQCNTVIHFLVVVMRAATNRLVCLRSVLGAKPKLGRSTRFPHSTLGETHSLITQHAWGDALAFLTARLGRPTRFLTARLGRPTRFLTARLGRPTRFPLSTLGETHSLSSQHT